jgi:hypothetical protein
MRINVNFADLEIPSPKKTGKPVAAGIIILFLGGYGLTRGVWKMTVGFYPITSYFGTLGIEMPGIILVITSLVCIIGAIQALKRDTWDVAFGGAIFSLFSSWPLALAAMLLLWRSRDELM